MGCDGCRWLWVDGSLDKGGCASPPEPHQGSQKSGGKESKQVTTRTRVVVVLSWVVVVVVVAVAEVGFG